MSAFGLTILKIRTMDKVFENHPNLKVYYKTSDGTAFYTESDAKLHAKSLENKNVVSVANETATDPKEKQETPAKEKKVTQPKQK